MTPRLGAQVPDAKSNQSSRCWVFIFSDAVASRASWVWSRGIFLEIFLACIPGSPREGRARKLEEGRAGGGGWGVMLLGASDFCSCKKGGVQGAGVPAARGKEGPGVLRPSLGRPKSQGLEARRSGRSGRPRGGAGRRPDAWDPPSCPAHSPRCSRPGAASLAAASGRGLGGGCGRAGTPS